MAKDDDETAILAKLGEKPPENFNPEYAKLRLAMIEGRKEKPLIDRVTVLVALVTSLVSITASVGTWWQYKLDRDERASKANFDNQITVTKVYFEKLAGGDFKGSCDDRMLFAKSALAVADVKEDAVKAEMASEDAVTPEASSPPAAATHAGPAPAVQVSAAAAPAAASGIGATGGSNVQALARLMYKDISRRAQRICDATKIATTTGVGGTLNAVAPAPDVPTSYTTGGPAGEAPPAPANNYSVYVQYLKDTDAKAKAVTLESAIDNVAGFHVPGIQGVEAVPSHDQIRVYRQTDIEKAKALRTTLKLDGAQIVNLETAYPKLPQHVMEVWLSH